LHDYAFHEAVLLDATLTEAETPLTLSLSEKPPLSETLETALTSRRTAR
jgi:hypothetical protein